MRANRGRGRPRLSDEQLTGRSDRILDAAAGLVLARGYDLVTVDDIAASACVAKGTIYSHWSNRDELFLDLVHREQSTLAAQLADTSPNTLEALMQQAATALLQRPLLVAILTGNSSVWGRLLRKLPAATIFGERFGSLASFLTRLRDHEQIRTDQTLNEQLHLVIGVLAGFLMARPLIPSAYAIDDHRLASLLADSICRSMSVSQEVPLGGTDVSRLLAGGDRTRSSSMQAALH